MFENKKIKALEARITELEAKVNEITATSYKLEKEEVQRIEQFNNLFAYNGKKQEVSGEY